MSACRTSRAALSSTVDEATWVLTSYMVANAVILPITGWLANYIGRKRLLMTVVTGFTVSSVLCGLAPSLPMLIFFRVLQGTTGGGLQPLSQAVLLEEFPGRERGKAMAFWGMGIMAAPILGPTLGGWITDTYSWRWVFYINLPIGILSLIMISLFLHDPPYIRRGTLRVDLWGLGMLAVGMGALQIMLDKGQEEDWFGSRFDRGAGRDRGGHADRIRHPGAVPSRTPSSTSGLLRYRTFAAGIGLATVLGFVLYGRPGAAAAVHADAAGLDGRHGGPLDQSARHWHGAVHAVVGYLLGKGWDGRRMLAFGFAIASLAFFGLLAYDLQSGTWDIFWIQINQGAAHGAAVCAADHADHGPHSASETGYATSLYSVMRNIGSSMGISFVTTWITRRSQFHQSVLASHVTATSRMSQEAMQQLTGVIQHSGIDRVTASHRAGALIYRTMQQQAALLSYVDVFHIMGILFLLVIPLVFLMKRSSHSIAR